MKLWATWEKEWVCCETALRSVPPQLERLIWTQGKYSEYLHNELKSTSICIRILIGWRRECVVSYEAGLVCHVGVCHDGKNKETDTGQRTSRCLVLTSSSQVWGHSSDSRLKLCVYVCVRVFVDLPLLLPGSDVTPSVATFGSSLNLWKQALGYIDVDTHTHSATFSHLCHNLYPRWHVFKPWLSPSPPPLSPSSVFRIHSRDVFLQSYWCLF